MEQCLFCQIIAGEIPADLVYRDEEFVAFWDINPQAPVHVLLVPNEHVTDAATYGAADPAGMGRLFQRAGRIADEMNVADGGYRMVFNTGTQAGQTVNHAHLHLLGGRNLMWPPG